MIKNRHSIRLKNYDYSQSGIYFVTICAQNRECIFGDAINGEMVLNNIGNMIEKWWNKIPNKYSHVELDVFQIMPNHLHGIIQIVAKIRVDTWVDPYGWDNDSMV